MANNQYQFYLNGTLVDEPIGWDESKRKVKRSEKYKGLFIEYVNDIKFHGDGYNLILSLFESTKFCGEIILEIYFRCSEFQNFQIYFNGIIKLKDCEFDLQKCQVKTIVNDNTLTNILTNLGDVEVDFSLVKSLNGQSVVATQTNINLHEVETGNHGAFSVDGYKVFDSFQFILDYISDNRIVFASTMFSNTTAFGLRDEVIILFTNPGVDLVNTSPNPNVEIDYTNAFGETFTLVIVKQATVAATLNRIISAFNFLTTGTPEEKFYEQNDRFPNYVITNGTTNVTINTDVDGFVITAVRFASASILVGASSIAFRFPNLTLTTGNQLRLGPISDRGDFDASANLFPTAGGSGPAGAVARGDKWTITVEGTLGSIGTISVVPGQMIVALDPTPGQDIQSWNILDFGMGGQSVPILSFDKLFDEMNKLFDLGMSLSTTLGVTTLRIEPIEYFYQKSNIQTLNNVTEIKYKKVSEYSKNRIDVGDGSDNNGAVGSQTQKSTWVGSNICFEEKLDIINDFITDSSEIAEQILAIEDRKDKKIFLIEVLHYDDGTSQRYENRIYSTNAGTYTGYWAYNARLNSFNKIKYWSFHLEGAVTSGDFTIQRRTFKRSATGTMLNLIREYEFKYPLSFSEQQNLILLKERYIEFNSGSDISQAKRGWIQDIDFDNKSGLGVFKVTTE